MIGQMITKRILSQLERLEASLQALVEGSAQRLFLGESPPDLGRRLVRAMHAGIQVDQMQHAWAPNLFVLSASPGQAEALRQDVDLLDALARTIQEAGDESGVEFSGPVVVRVVGDALLPTGEVRVNPHHSPGDLPDTTAMNLAEALSTPQEAAALTAYLIVDGTRLFTLPAPVANIGRRADNHLVIEDQRVSRVHAQIRLVRGRFIIFDLDSRGGTWVNGQRVNQKELVDGDVISLAGVPLVFGLEKQPGEDTAEIGWRGEQP